MILLLLGAAVIAWWFWGRHFSRQQLAAIGSLLAGAYMLFRGNWAVGLPMVLPAIWLFVQQQGWTGGGTAPPALDIDEARRILGVAPDADSNTIREAHRRLVTRVHPDQGGTVELASKVNAARDILLAELQKR